MGHLLIILQDFVPEFGIGSIIDKEQVLVKELPGPNRFIANLIDAGGYFPDKPVGTGAGAIRDHHNHITRLGNIQSRGQADGGSAGIGVPQSWGEQARFELFFSESEHFADSYRELTIWLMKDDIIEIGRFHTGFLHQTLGAAEAVLEISRVAGKAAAMLRILAHNDGAEELGQRARAKVEQIYDIETVAESFLRLYRTLV